MALKSSQDDVDNLSLQVSKALLSKTTIIEVTKGKVSEIKGSELKALKEK